MLPAESASPMTGTLDLALTIITGCYINDSSTPAGLTNLDTITFSLK
ncbi:Spore coat U domain protein [Yersinia aldovae ATCC 35236]|nr:Spore coat U domain protein [Yersinia aldovae ATCC 35236]